MQHESRETSDCATPPARPTVPLFAFGQRSPVECLPKRLSKQPVELAASLTRLDLLELELHFTAASPLLSAPPLLRFSSCATRGLRGCTQLWCTPLASAPVRCAPTGSSFILRPSPILDLAFRRSRAIKVGSSSNQNPDPDPNSIPTPT